MRTGRILVVLLGAAAVTAGLGRSHVTRAAPGRLAAYDLATGAMRFDTPAPTASVHLHAIGDGVVVATGADDCSAPTRERAFEIGLADGALRWSRTLGGACDDDAPADTLAAGTVAVQGRRGISGWSTRDGSLRWTRPGLSDPRQLGGTIVGSTDDATTAVDAGTGRAYVTTVIPHNSALVYASAGIALFGGPSGGLVAVDLRRGRRLWRGSGEEVSGAIAPIVGNDGAFVARGAVRDLRSGRRLWTAGGAIVAAGAGLALEQVGGELRARDIRTGALRWEVPRPAHTRAAQVVAGGGAVALVDLGAVRVLDAATGATRWRAALDPAGYRFQAPVAIAGGLLLLPSTSSAWVPYDE